MIDPRLALALFFALVTLALVLFWPSTDLWWRGARRVRTGGQREAIEDALKHLYKTERRGAAASLESVAGALDVPLARAAEIVRALGEHGLVDAGDLTLTAEGTTYALQVIRTHRLWERYLADRTGTPPVDWHASAETREHELTPAQADEIAAQLGHPRYDPHGDPIPTASGEIPDPAGVPLTHLSPGDSALVIHLEDEPEALYHHLVAAGISPGHRIRVLAVDDHRTTVEYDGRRQELDLVTAGNVTVLPAGEAAMDLDGDEGDYRTLDEVALGEEAEVIGISPACQGIQRRRLLDLGVVPGTRIRAELVAAGGDPVAFLIRGALIALRREQQQWIRIAADRKEEAA